MCQRLIVYSGETQRSELVRCKPQLRGFGELTLCCHCLSSFTAVIPGIQRIFCFRSAEDARFGLPSHLSDRADGGCVTPRCPAASRAHLKHTFFPCFYLLCEFSVIVMSTRWHYSFVDAFISHSTAQKITFLKYPCVILKTRFGVNVGTDAASPPTVSQNRWTVVTQHTVWSFAVKPYIVYF